MDKQVLDLLKQISLELKEIKEGYEIMRNDIADMSKMLGGK